MIPVLASAALAEGKCAEVIVEGAAVALARVEGVVYAVVGACPHRGGPLGQGDLSGHHLYCPLHAWSFDVRTGASFFPPNVTIATHAVEEREGQIWVDPKPRPVPIDFVPPGP